MAATGVRIGISLSPLWDRFGRGGKTDAFRAELAQHIRWATGEGQRLAHSLATPPQRVPRKTEVLPHQNRIKNNITGRVSEDGLHGTVESLYKPEWASGGKKQPPAVNMFFEFGTGRAGSSAWRVALGGVSLPTWWSHGSKNGMAPQAFMTPAYLVVSEQLKRRIGVSTASLMRRLWR